MAISNIIAPAPSGSQIFHTFQLGSYAPSSDTFTLALDLNDQATWFLAPRSVNIETKTRDVRSSNPRAAGELIVKDQYLNTTVTATFAVKSAVSSQAVLDALHAMLKIVRNPPFTIRFAHPLGTSYTYLDVQKCAVQKLPTDGQQLLAKAKTGITLLFEGRGPGWRGDRLTLQNLVVNPGFESPIGGTQAPAVVAFADPMSSVNAYAVQAGGAPTLAPANTYVDIVQANGGASLLRYHRLGESSGTTAYDLSGNGQNGTTHGSPTQGVAGLLSGDTDTCYTFAAASSQYVSSPVTGLPTGSAAISVGVWCKFAANPAANSALVAYGATGGGAHNGIDAYIDTSGRPVLEAFNGAGIITGTALALNTPHLVVGTWDGTSLKLYADGALIGTTTPGAATIPTSSTVCYFGAFTGASSFWSGQLDECCVWSAALTGTQISNIYNAGHTGATGTVANAMSLPAAARVSFGSPAWGALQTWQCRFRYVSTLTGTFYLHYTDANNHLRAVVASGTNAFQLIHTIAGTATVLAQATVALVHEGWYWLQLVQFPTVPGNPPYLTATLSYDNAGAVGAQVAQIAAAANDAVTAEVGAPQIAASGAALAIGGLASGAGQQVALFGPGGWTFSAANGGSSGAWDGSRGELGMSGNATAGTQTYGAGPVTSFGAARMDLAPAGAVDCRWRLYAGGAPAGTWAIPVKAATDVLEWQVALKTAGLAGASATVTVLLTEYDASGALLRTGTVQTLTGGALPAAWTQYTGTYTTGASCAYCDLSVRVVDATANSANGRVWIDNALVQDQTMTGTSLAGAWQDLRGPVSPYQVVTSGLRGDVAANAWLGLGTFFKSIIATTAATLLLGRRLYVHQDAMLAGASSTNAVPVLDATSWGGYYHLAAAFSGTLTADLFNQFTAIAPAVGTYRLLARLWSDQSQIGKVTVQAQVYELGQVVGAPILATATSAPLTAASTWTVCDTGQIPLPPSPAGALQDLTQVQLYADIDITDNIGSNLRYNWAAYLPTDASLLLARYGTSGSVQSNQYRWFYADGLVPAPGAPAWGYSVGTAGGGANFGPLPSPQVAVGSGGLPTASETLVPSGDPSLTLDPSLATPAGAAGVNQLLGVVADQLGTVLPLFVEVAYAPQYLYPR